MTRNKKQKLAENQTQNSTQPTAAAPQKTVAPQPAAALAPQVSTATREQVFQKIPAEKAAAAPASAPKNVTQPAAVPQKTAAQPAPTAPKPAATPVQNSAPVANPAAISAPNSGAKPVPKFANSLLTNISGDEAKQLKADQEALDEKRAQADKSATKQLLNHPENAAKTKSFVQKLFGKSTPKKPAEQNSTTKTPPIKNAEKIYQEGLASVRDLIAPSSMEIHFNHIQLSGVFARSFFVFTYPRYLDTNWLSPIVNFDATLDISQFIYPISSEAIMSTLKKKVAQIQSSIRMAQEKGNVRDPVLETALEDAEQLRTDLQRGQEKFFQFGMYFTVYAEDEKKLESATKQLESLLGGKLVLTKRADIQGEHALNSTLPLALDELSVQRNMNTSPLSTTFPFISSSLTSNEGILYGLNRHNDSLVIFDRFKLPNANSTVFATSGAGKSYAVKLEILRTMMLGSDVIVIDPENEYQALAEEVGGTYLRISLNSEQRINPFDLPEAFDGQDLKPGDLLRENVVTLTGLMKLMLGEMTPAEAALVDKALIDTYAVRGITMDHDDPKGVPPPTMEDFYSVLSSMKGAENLATRLQKFTSGTFGGIFNKPTNVDLGSGLIVFCIRDLEDELRPIATYIILNYIWSRVRSKLKKRMLVIDEAWSLMQHDDAAKFLYGLVKRARKYYLGVTTITQDVEDFLRSPYGKPIVTNASLAVLLKQAPSAIEILQKTFNLTEGEKYMLLNSGVGQGLFFADNKHVAIQIIASYSEDKIITTNPEQILAAREE